MSKIVFLDPDTGHTRQVFLFVLACPMYCKMCYNIPSLFLLSANNLPSSPSHSNVNSFQPLPVPLRRQRATTALLVNKLRAAVRWTSAAAHSMQAPAWLVAILLSASSLALEQS